MIVTRSAATTWPPPLVVRFLVGPIGSLHSEIRVALEVTRWRGVEPRPVLVYPAPERGAGGW